VVMCLWNGKAGFAEFVANRFVGIKVHLPIVVVVTVRPNRKHRPRKRKVSKHRWCQAGRIRRSSRGWGSLRGSTDFERHLCVGRAGFTLHAGTRAGGADAAGREALLKYILRPAVAQERIVPGRDGLVRIVLKRAFSDGTIAVDLDPLSLLSRLAASVPYPRFHTVRYGGVLASASKVRPKIAPKPPSPASDGVPGEPVCVHTAWDRDAAPPDAAPARRGPYRPWAELLKRTFAFDVLTCHSQRCLGRMKLVALLTEQGRELRRCLRAMQEPTELPAQAPARGPPYWHSRALRRKELGDHAA
jgi:hypothetical protein